MNDPAFPSPLPPTENSDSGRALALEKVKLPGLFLIITGALNAMMTLSQAVSSSAGTDQQMKKLLDTLQKAGDPGTASQVEKLFSMTQNPSFVVPQILLGLVISGVIIAGGIMMMQLKVYPLAIAAALLAIICCNCCYFIGIPVGIWALVVLLDDKVKAQFT